MAFRPHPAARGPGHDVSDAGPAGDVLRLAPAVTGVLPPVVRVIRAVRQDGFVLREEAV